MKRSTALIGQAASLTAGGAGLTGGLNAQCLVQVAPCSTHRRSTAICSGDSGLPVFFGGICTSGSLLSIRAISSLSSGLPGTIARAPLSSSAKAAFLGIEPQAGLAGLVIGPVAGEAVIRQDRPDVPREADRASACPRRASPSTPHRRAYTSAPQRARNASAIRRRDAIAAFPFTTLGIRGYRAVRPGPSEPRGRRRSRTKRDLSSRIRSGLEIGYAVAETSRRAEARDRARLDIGDAVPSWPEGGSSDRNPIPGGWRPA